MKEAIGSVPLYNFIIIFIVVTFAFLSATLSYMKAFKINSNIAKQLERYEGYNSKSEKEINDLLGTLGYRKSGTVSTKCKDNKSGKTLITGKNGNYPICIYKSNKLDKYGYFHYGIVTYIFLDIPFLGSTFSIPIYSETERIYKFSPDEFK
jgi:hypothetical protein